MPAAFPVSQWQGFLPTLALRVTMRPLRGRAYSSGSVRDSHPVPFSAGPRRGWGLRHQNVGAKVRQFSQSAKCAAKSTELFSAQANGAAVLEETSSQGSWHAVGLPNLPPPSRIHTSSLAHPYFLLCPDIPPALGRNSINYVAVYKKYVAVNTNYVAVYKNYDVVYRMRRQRRRNIWAEEEVWMSKRGSMDRQEGVAAFPCSPDSRL